MLKKDFSIKQDKIKFKIYNPSKLVVLPNKVRLNIPEKSMSYDRLKYLDAQELKFENIQALKSIEHVLFPALEHFKFEELYFDVRFQDLHLDFHMQNLKKLSLYGNNESTYLIENISFLTTCLKQLEELDIQISNCTGIHLGYFSICDKNDKSYNEICDLEKFLLEQSIHGVFIYNPPKTLKKLFVQIFHDNFYVSSSYLEHITIHRKVTDYYYPRTGKSYYAGRIHHLTNPPPIGFGDKLNKKCRVELINIENANEIYNNNLKRVNIFSNVKLKFNKLKICKNITNINNSNILYGECYKNNIRPLKWSMLKNIDVWFDNENGLSYLDLSCCLNLEHVSISNASVKLSNRKSHTSLKTIIIKKGYCWNQINEEDENEFVCSDSLFPILTTLSIAKQTSNTTCFSNTLTINIQEHSVLKKINLNSLESKLKLCINNVNQLTFLVVKCNRKIANLDIKFDLLHSLSRFIFAKNHFESKETKEFVMKNNLNNIISWFKYPCENNLKTLDMLCNEKTFVLNNFDLVRYLKKDSHTKSCIDSYYDNGCILNIHYEGHSDYDSDSDFEED